MILDISVQYLNLIFASLDVHLLRDGYWRVIFAVLQSFYRAHVTVSAYADRALPIVISSVNRWGLLAGCRIIGPGQVAVLRRGLENAAGDVDESFTVCDVRELCKCAGHFALWGAR